MVACLMCRVNGDLEGDGMAAERLVKVGHQVISGSPRRSAKPRSGRIVSGLGTFFLRPFTSRESHNKFGI